MQELVTPSSDRANEPVEAFDSLYEVFVRPQNGVDYVHCGSVRAGDADHALEHARTLFARRETVGSLWLVPTSAIITSPPDEAPAWFEPALHHPYRSASYYEVPEGVRGL